MPKNKTVAHPTFTKYTKPGDLNKTLQVFQKEDNKKSFTNKFKGTNKKMF